MMLIPSLLSIKGFILFAILFYASVRDIKTRRVPDCISVMLFILSFVGIEMANIPSMLLGAIVVFVPQLAFALAKPSKAFGGADIKISTALGFMLGVEKGLFALIIGLAIAVIVMAIQTYQHEAKKGKPFPLVPFLSIGGMLAYLI